MGLLWLGAKRNFKLTVRGIGLKSPVFSTLIMALFLLLFNKFVDMNIFWGIVELLLGVVIYFGVLILTKGVTNEDWKLLKSLIKK